MVYQICTACLRNHLNFTSKLFSKSNTKLMKSLREVNIRLLSTSKIRQEQVSMNVFDRKAKLFQRNRAAMLEDVAVYDYLKDEVMETPLIRGSFARIP